MDLKEKLSTLGKILSLHDSIMGEGTCACKKGCSACCTCNVTMTTLEGYYILQEIPNLKIDIKKIRQLLLERQGKKRFIPKITINQMAEYIIKDRELPEEEMDPAWGQCPFLSNDECMIYHARPLGCRVLVSKFDCRKMGYADMEPFTLTVNNLFMQVVEHIDFGGSFGNLTDVFLDLQGSASCSTDDSGVSVPEKDLLILNHVMPILMIPHIDQEQIRPILNKLSKILPEVLGNLSL